MQGPIQARIEERSPGTFATVSAMISCSKPEDLPESYTRFLVNGLRKDFGMKGVPIRIAMRKGDNPYAGKKKPRGHRGKEG